MHEKMKDERLKSKNLDKIEQQKMIEIDIENASRAIMAEQQQEINKKKYYENELNKLLSDRRE